MTEEEYDGKIDAPEETEESYGMRLMIPLRAMREMPPEEFTDLLDLMLLEARKRFFDEYRLRQTGLRLQ